MKNSRLRKALITLLATTAVSPAAFAGNFLHTDAGPYDYNDTANWSGAVINNTWGTSLTANQAVTFGADTTLSGSLSISNTGTFNHTFTGTGANRTVTLGGGISLGSNSSNANKVTLGSTTDGQRLNLDLGSASRTFFTGTNRTLEILNVVSSSSGTFSITKTGTGTLILANSANSYTNGTNIGTSGQASGVLEVTKLADGGQDSSIGKSSNAADKLVFGGTTAGGGTLRYVGSGDSTDRRFLVGGTGAIFDASGTGAITWTNTAAATFASTGVARTITFKGASTHDNTMSAAFADSGVGKTSLTKEGAGTWILAGANTATGDITVTEGTLGIGADNRLGDTARLVLNGGTFSTGGFDETVGTLLLSADSIIDLGNNVSGSALAFSNSSGETWTGSVLVGRFPADLVVGRLALLATHPTFSADRRSLNIDARFILRDGTPVCYLGELPLDGSPFRLWQKIEGLYLDHGLFSPTDPDLQLIAHEYWQDHGHLKPFDGATPYHRIWLVRRGQKAEPFLREPVSHSGHEWWSADGQHIWYLHYGVGVKKVSLATREETLVWPAHFAHAHSSACGRYLVADRMDRPSPSDCNVFFFDCVTGKQIEIVNRGPLAPHLTQCGHLHPHPQFCLHDRYVCYTTTIHDRVDVALVSVTDLITRTA